MWRAVRDVISPTGLTERLPVLALFEYGASVVSTLAEIGWAALTGGAADLSGVREVRASTRPIYFKDEWGGPQHIRIEIRARSKLIDIEVVRVALKTKTGHGTGDRTSHPASQSHRDIENIVGSVLGKCPGKLAIQGVRTSEAHALAASSGRKGQVKPICIDIPACQA